MAWRRLRVRDHPWDQRRECVRYLYNLIGHHESSSDVSIERSSFTAIALPYTIRTLTASVNAHLIS